MATKSDFAQKLLHDLRLRKERMAAESNGSSSTTGSNGNTGSAYKGYEQTNTYESIGLKSGNSSSKPNSRSKSFQLEETSNHHQLVPYINGGQTSGQTGNSSTTMELAFHRKTNGKGRNPMLNFLQEIGRRSLGKGNIEIKTSFGNNSNPDSHVITFSEVHIGEISKGIQKLNQILKNCSKGVHLERYSTDVGKELLKGAIDLEQSLRMLSNVNQRDDYTNKTRRGKNKIKLVEVKEDDDGDGNKNARLNDLKQVERPRFSFDNPNKNARKTKQAAKPLVLTYSEETQTISKRSIHSRSVSMDLEAEIERISSRPQPKNPTTSNVIAKLMGLEDLPRKPQTFHDLQPQHMKSKPLFTKTKDSLRSKTMNPESIYEMKTEKKMTMSPDLGSSTMLINEDDTCAGSVTSSPAMTVDKQQEIKIIQIDKHHGNQEAGREDNREEKEKNIIATSKIEDPLLQEKTQYKIPSEAKQVSERKHEKHSANHNLQLQKKLRKLEEKQNLLQHSKQKPLTQNKTRNKNSPRDSDKNQASKKLDISTGKKMPVKQVEANRQPKYTFNRRHGLDSSATGETDEMKISKIQIHRKTDVGLNRNEIVLKPEPHSVVSELMVQENDKKTKISGLAIAEPMEQRDDKVTRISRLTKGIGPPITEAVSSQAIKPEMSSQASKLTELLRKLTDQSPVYSKPPTENANVQIINIAEEAPEVTNDFQASQNPSVCADDIEMEPLKNSLPQHKGDHEIKPVAIHIAENKQTRNSPSWSADQLTESENQLKEILIKNQLFLHTAEALFKLNIPVIVLHDAADHNDNLADNELILDCGIELLKKKGKRRQLSCYPFKSLDCAIMFQSFDELIKQLNKDIYQLNSYGGEWDEECDPSENIYQMLEKDVQYKDPDVNSMWDFGWYEETIASSEKDELIKEVEKHMLRKLLDELTRDYLDAGKKKHQIV